MEVDKVVLTWRILGFYIQCLKELSFAKSISTGNNCLLIPDMNHYMTHKESIQNTRE